MNKIAKNIEASVLEFTRLVAEKYDLQQDTLMEMWTDVTKMKTKASQAKKPPSAYQVFSAEQRKLIKEEDPDMAFGEIAKEIGKRWRKLSADEKAAYATAEGAVTVNKSSPKKKKGVKKPPVTPTSSDEDDLHSLSKQRLLEMCAAKGIKMVKSKNKEQIIAAIQEADEGSIKSVAASEASDNLHSLSKQRLLEICATKGIKIATNKSKDQIIAAIQEADEADAKSSDDEASVKSVEASEDDAASVAAASEDDAASVAASEKTLEEEDEEKDMLSVYKSMKTQDLAEICKEKNLPSKGTREILIRRLLTALAQ